MAASVNFKVNPEVKNQFEIGKGIRLAKRVHRGSSFENAFENLDKCEFSRGQYWAIRERLSVGDINGAKKILSRLEKETLNRVDGYNGQDRYFGLGAGAIGMYIAVEQKDSLGAAKFIETAFGKTDKKTGDYLTSNMNAKLAIVEVASCCSAFFQILAMKLAAKGIGGTVSETIAKKKIDGAKLRVLPDY